MILAFDTATPAGSVALVDEERVLVGRYFEVGLQHSQRLFAEIDQAFAVAGLGFGDVDGVAVTGGPGSFTGLRIGLSAAKGFCLAMGSPLITVSTLETIAARFPFARHPVCPMLDARKGEVYAALFDTTDGEPRPLTESRAIAPVDLLAERAGEPTIFVGDGAQAYGDLLAAAGERALLAPSHCSRPDAGALGRLALARLRAGRVADLASAEPDYLREADAKVGRKLFPRT